MLPSPPCQRSQVPGHCGFRGPFLASMGMLAEEEFNSRLSSSTPSDGSSSRSSDSPLRLISALGLPTDLHRLQSILNPGNFPNITILNMDILPSHLHHVHRLHLSDSTMLHLSVAPPPNVSLLRHERHALQTESLILSLLGPIGLPVASVVRHDPTDKLLGAPFLLTTSLPGVPLSKLLLSRSAPQGLKRVAIEEHLNRLVNTITSHSALMFGPAPLVAIGKGFDNWKEAFKAMLADAIKDAEDAFIHLPYGQVWDAFEKAGPAFDDVQQPRLVVPGLGKASNVLVQVSRNDEVRVSGLVGFQRAFWGDSEMGTVIDGGIDGQIRRVDTGLFFSGNRRRKILLYKIYGEIIAIATAAYRPRGADMQELDSRKELTSCLAKLRALG